MDGLFAIRYGDVTLDVAEGSRLTVEWMSVLFNEDSLFAGSYSYPILFPLTPTNKAVFTNAHVLENRGARRKLQVLVQLYGQSWKRGMLAFDVTANGYEGDLQIDSGTVAEWMRERSLASVFTISNNGKFAKHIPVKVSSTEPERKAKILDSCENPGKYPWVFFPMRNELRTGDLEALPSDDPPDSKRYWFVNEWGGGFFTPQVNRLFCPFFYLTWVIGEVCKWMGFEATGSFLTHPEVRTWVIYNTGMIGGAEFNNGSLELYPARHLPGMSVAAFLKALRNDLKVAIYFDSHTRKARFDLPDDVLSRTDAVDVSASIEAGTMRIKRNAVDGYRLRTMVDDGDECYTLHPYVRDYTIGLSETPRAQDLQTGTLFMYRGPMYLNATAEHRMPWARQTANIYDEAYRETEAYNQPDTYGRNDFKLRLIAYKGMVPWGALGNSGMIPYATCDNLNELEEPAYDYSMQPGGASGWLSKFCLTWYEMLCSTEPLDFIARLDVATFMRLSPLRKMLLAGDSRAVIPALPDRVTFEPTDTGRIVACRVLAYPHYNRGALAEDIEVGFSEGEVVVPEITIYARLAPENERYTTNKSKEKRRVADVVLYFYRDNAGTIPYSVTALPVRILRNYNNSGTGVNADFTHDVTADGERYVALVGWEVYHWIKPTLWNLWQKYDARTTFTLDVSPDGSYQKL
ncbi:MAG TPA: hypothetical protein VNQ80_15490 [Parapedobacter sp.]|uniref:hypothetical protein n=1 Tax=Parapedobacter sp. TaxID=1958893 RepID=UPI002C1841D4|nr:hypothetical protein [Parapedobacter sp.]HWK58746.1 hypothetical protein [Parapedobacter sp.]